MRTYFGPIRFNDRFFRKIEHLDGLEEVLIVGITGQEPDRQIRLKGDRCGLIYNRESEFRRTCRPVDPTGLTENVGLPPPAEAVTTPPADPDFFRRLTDIAEADVRELLVKDADYGGSWKRRGGIGAFMMAARKWDRLEESVTRHGYDVFATAETDVRAETALNTIGDLRRYLLLIEDEVRRRLEKTRK